MAFGPFVIALPRLFLFLGVLSAALTAWLWERRSGASIEKPLWWSLLVGLVAARIGYVATHLPDFQNQPLQALYVWQDGYLPVVGVAAAIATVLWLALRNDRRIVPMLAPLLVGITVWGGASWLSHALTSATRPPLPEISVIDIHGQSQTLSSFKGKPVVLNLWATWCPPCRREMPVLAHAQQAQPDVHFLFVNQGEGSEKISRYLVREQLKLDNVLLDAGGTIGRYFAAPGLPTTLFFDADGQLVRTHVGELSRARLGDYVSALRRK
jgi:thiol-disulfide isomerase/thioredoxin